MNDSFTIGNQELTSRLFVGTGKFSNHTTMKEAILSSNSDVVTVALRRVDLSGEFQYMVNDIPEHVTYMPNTSGARTADEAVRIARLGRAAGLGDWVKIEVISDQKYLLPDNEETIRATERLVEEGFIVFPYMSPDLMTAKRLEKAGAAAVMPLGAPIGTNRGLEMKSMIQVIINESNVPIVVDAGIGQPSHAAEAMEMGADAVLVNTAIATAQNPVEMAKAFDLAVRAGRIAYLNSHLAPSEEASASSPLTGFLS
ncbi:thiazole synthase [Pontibacillus halophilus JSM 076056 = DSM 19796]|uniref:Thiazole synthase n=1 Tax=Pontibacillus halophilus JSM 076056 = DSM 19796 TaxID=1385510 RepID=A0A0A5GMM0_9BACI|nr:thiazole synthase [Pontibacillus halophilus]KGX92415.1 thiazole synthase [Pontibacillus halophilus JSM 076056 = DSM 19796]